MSQSAIIVELDIGFAHVAFQLQLPVVLVGRFESPITRPDGSDPVIEGDSIRCRSGQFSSVRGICVIRAAMASVLVYFLSVPT